MKQGTPEWFDSRVGCCTASRCYDAIAKTKSGWSASRERYMDELITERLIGRAQDHFISADMMWGIEQEPLARAAYEFENNVTVQEVGSIPHPVIEWSSASPDGLVGDDGLIEIKCPKTTTMVSTVLSGQIPKNYVTQMTWQLACTQRKWCDFVMFDPRLPPANQIWIQRYEPEEDVITQIEEDVKLFLLDLQVRLKTFQSQTAG
tara:strand:- start:426 stop:1040 length:615 start_codon:yes stop_codon:yes gene_type:complete